MLSLPSKEYELAPTTLAEGVLLRALEVNAPTSKVSPYQRDVMKSLLTAVGGINAEQALFDQQSNLFTDYVFYGTRTATLLSRSGEISQFAQSIPNSSEVTLMTEEELFPELFANPSIPTNYFEYLVSRLDDEYELFSSTYTRAVLASVPLKQLDSYFHKTLLTSKPTKYFDKGKIHYSPLIELLKPIVQKTSLLSSKTQQDLTLRYKSEMLLL